MWSEQWNYTRRHWNLPTWGGLNLQPPIYLQKWDSWQAIVETIKESDSCLRRRWRSIEKWGIGRMSPTRCAILVGRRACKEIISKHGPSIRNVCNYHVEYKTMV